MVNYSFWETLIFKLLNWISFGNELLFFRYATFQVTRLSVIEKSVYWVRNELLFDQLVLQLIECSREYVFIKDTWRFRNKEWFTLKWLERKQHLFAFCNYRERHGNFKTVKFKPFFIEIMESFRITWNINEEGTRKLQMLLTCATPNAQY